MLHNHNTVFHRKNRGKHFNVEHANAHSPDTVMSVLMVLEHNLNGGVDETLRRKK